jgi:hypothetical protein
MGFSDILGLGANFLAGGGLGFAARGAMQIVGFFQQRQSDRQTLEMRKLDIEQERFLAESSRETAKLVAEGTLAAIEATGRMDEITEQARAFTEAQRKAYQPTGNLFIDGSNAFMRPFGYYSILIFYFGWKIAYLCSAIGPELMLVDVLVMGWGDLDSALLGSAWGFVWADRSFSKNTVSAASVRP